MSTAKRCSPSTVSARRCARVGHEHPGQAPAAPRSSVDAAASRRRDQGRRVPAAPAGTAWPVAARGAHRSARSARAVPRRGPSRSRRPRALLPMLAVTQQQVGVATPPGPPGAAPASARRHPHPGPRVRPEPGALDQHRVAPRGLEQRRPEPGAGDVRTGSDPRPGPGAPAEPRRPAPAPASTAARTAASRAVRGHRPRPPVCARATRQARPAGILDDSYAVPADPPAQAPGHPRAPRPGARDAPRAGGLRLPDVRRPRHRPPRADRGDAGHRPPVDRPRRRRGRRGRGAGDPRGAAVRAPGRQGRGGLGRVGRRGHRPARHAGDQGGPPRAAGDHRPVPVRVHEPRPLRRASRAGRRASTTTPRWSCSPAPPSRRPAPAPTSSPPAT